MSEDEEVMVLGHMCDGLRKYQLAADYMTCIPCLGEDGETQGCDASNYVPIHFCPFCATPLPFKACGKCEHSHDSGFCWHPGCDCRGLEEGA